MSTPLLLQRIGAAATEFGVLGLSEPLVCLSATHERADMERIPREHLAELGKRGLVGSGCEQCLRLREKDVNGVHIFPFPA